MSMSGDEMRLHGPEVSAREKSRIRLKRLARFWICSAIGIMAVLFALIVISTIYFGLPELVRLLHR